MRAQLGRAAADGTAVLGLLVAVCSTAATSTLLRALGADAATAVLVLMVCVTASALVSPAAGLVASALGAAALSYVFIPPQLAFSLGKREDLLALVTFTFLAVTISSLLARVRLAQQQAREAAVAAADAEAQAALSRTRAAFFAAAGHNLRTPLTSIKTAAATLAARPNGLTAQDQRALVLLVRDEADRLDRLTTRVLDLARIRAGVLEPDLEEVDLVSLVQSAIDRVRLTAPALRFRSDMAEPAPATRLDVIMTEQVLLNLLENAAAFGPAQSEVVVEGRAGDHGYEVRVRDSGPGVAEAERAGIFDEFHSGRRRVDARASGLGLAIARALAEVQSCRLRYEETPGGGATFLLAVPAAVR